MFLTLGNILPIKNLKNYKLNQKLKLKISIKTSNRG